MANETYDPMNLGTEGDIAALVGAELERAASVDHEARLQVLEDLYHSLEAQLDSSGSDALG